MVKYRWLKGLILKASFVICICLLSSPLAFATDRVNPDWFTKLPRLYSSYEINENDGLEEQVPCYEHKVFDIQDSWGGTYQKKLCVMKARSFKLAVDQSGYWMFVSIGLSTEYHAVSKDSWNRFYTIQGSDSVVVFRRMADVPRIKFTIQSDFLKHLSLLPNGYMTYDWADGEFPAPSQGDIVPSAWAFSNNGRYLVYSYGISYPNNDRVVIVDLANGKKKIIGSLHYGTYYSPPAPGPRLAISDNGSLVVAGGPKWTKFWDTSSECGVTDLEESGWGIEVDSCRSALVPPSIFGININPPYDDFVSYNFNISHKNDLIEFTIRKGMNDHEYTYNRVVIRPYNTFPYSGIYYIALGDSFASGEGDMSNSNETYYIPGTDIVGKYPNIPQEMCHISSRSYPFLIASKMGLSAGGSMKSVACSGAVANDVLTFDTNNFERILADNYMGQGRIGSGGPRLLGVPNAPALQAEARQSTLPGRVQQIELVQKTKPEAVTIMMGGNDLGFGSIMMGCANLWNWGRFDGDCEQTTGPGEVKMVRAIQAMYPEWLHMYKNIKKNTSSGKVYVIGYPHFLASDNICSEMAGLYSATERKSINQTIDYANATMKNAALDAGVWFIDVHDSLEGKELCGRSTGVTGIDNLAFQAIMSEYMRYKDEMDNNIKQYGLLGRLYNMNPTFLTTYQANRSAELAVDAAMNPSVTFGKTFQQLSHPNSVGHQAIFDRIASGLGPDMLDSEVCNAIVACPELDDTGGVVGQRGIPSPGQYIEGITMDSTGQVYVNGDGVISIGGKIDKAIEKSAGDAYELTEDIITRYHIDVSVPMKLYIHSTPTYLGTFESVNGKYIVRAAVPESVPVGMHTLHVSAATTGGKELDIVKYVMVLGPRGDVDDDGTPDGSDRCAFGDASSQDGDSDGLADNCDMYVAPAASKPVVSTPSHLAGTTKPLSTGILPAVIGDNASSGFDTSLPAQSSTDLKSDEQVRATLEPTNTASGQTSSIQSGSVWWVVMSLALAIVTGYIVRRQRS